jgi:hypothetical protein
MHKDEMMSCYRLLVTLIALRLRRDWFLCLVRIHVVSPGQEVGFISDIQQGILSVVQEQIPRYAPMHHRWCAHHLVENLLQKDRTKNNFPLFEEVYRQLEVSFFEDKLKDLKAATNVEGKIGLLDL